ncbi:MAG TPA: hypothetical protein VFM05_07410 [Candidatus Saccharimonadales bacterium]|nr:hypothetical protein [Candidatus Saccharimonadales bacterium]
MCYETSGDARDHDSYVDEPYDPSAYTAYGSGDALVPNGDGDDIPDDLPTDNEDPKEPAVKRPPFGELSTGQLEAAHPYLPAEQVDPEAIEAYYASIRLKPETWLGWGALELGIHQGDRSLLDEARAHFDRATEIYELVNPNTTLDGMFAGPGDAKAWYNAAFVRAHLAGFRDRMTSGGVRPSTALGVYHELARGVLPYTVDEGDAAEAIVSALGARAAALGRTPEYLSPSSPREGHSAHHDDEGRTFNHDLYRVRNGLKDPIEVKVRAGGQTSRPSRYSPGTTRINVMNDLGRSILGSYINRVTPRADMKVLVSVFLATTRRLMEAEVKGGERRLELDQAANRLHQVIQEDRANKSLDPRFRSPRLAGRARRRY